MENILRILDKIEYINKHLSLIDKTPEGKDIDYIFEIRKTPSDDLWWFASNDIINREIHIKGMCVFLNSLKHDLENTYKSYKNPYDYGLAQTLRNINMVISEFGQLKNLNDFTYEFLELDNDNDTIAFKYEKDDIITHDMLIKAFLTYLNTIYDCII